MPHFVYDNTDLDFPKTDKTPVPGGEDASQYVAASEWNNNCQGTTDIRNMLRGAKFFGFEAQASDPAPAGIANYVWVNNGGVLSLKFGASTYRFVNTVANDVQVLSASTSEGDPVEVAAYGNGVDYLPLAKGDGTTVAFKFRAHVAGDYCIEMAYAMSVANSGNVELRVDKRIITEGGDPSAAVTAGTAFTITPGNNTTMHRMTDAASSDLKFTVAEGDIVLVELQRTTGAPDTHTGDVRVLNLAVRSC